VWSVLCKSNADGTHLLNDNICIIYIKLSKAYVETNAEEIYKALKNVNKEEKVIGKLIVTSVRY